MKKVLILLLVIILAISMMVMGISCKEEMDITSEEETTEQEEIAEETTEETTEKEEVTEEDITIRAWFASSEEFNSLFMESVAKPYMEKHPNINIEAYLQPTTGFDEKIMAAFISGDEPDLVMTAEDFGLEIEQKYGAWLNFADYGALDWESVKIMDPDVLEALTYDGKLFGLQVTDQPMAIFVRKSWVENVGWEKDYPYIESWDDLVKLAEKFTFEDPDQNGQDDTWGYEMFGSMDRNYAAVQFGMIMNFIGEKLVQDGKLNINTEKGLATLQFMQKAVHEYKISPPDTAAYTHVEFYRDVAAGVVGMGRLGGWNVAGWMEALNGDFVPVKFPSIEEGGEAYIPTTFNEFNVSKNTKHPEEVLEFVQYLLSKEVQTIYTRDLPNINGYRPDLDWVNLTDSEQELFFYTELTKDKVNRVYGITDRWYTADAKEMLSGYVQQVLIDGDLDCAAILKEADEQINANFAPAE